MEKNLVKTDLIIDVGMHRGEDTEFYLHQGYKVVAIDADPNLIKAANEKYRTEISEGRLSLVHCAISDQNKDEVGFNIGELTLWNSLEANITSRDNNTSNSIRVPMRSLASIVEEYGTPFYCKIDIEGHDEKALKSLSGHSLPEFISVESECIGEDDHLSDEQALSTLETLYVVGYRHFKLVDQTSLEVLKADRKFYTNTKMNYYKLRHKLKMPVGMHKKLEKEFNFAFPHGSSGLFGEQLHGQWMDHDQARAALLRHRRDYFKLKKAVNYGFWCDWHAKK